MDRDDQPYYRDDLALVHHRGFGMVAQVRHSFGTEQLPTGLRALIGHRPA